LKKISGHTVLALFATLTANAQKTEYLKKMQKVKD
jgi:hypothetical protein